MSASALKEMTHAEPPWRDARGGTPDGGWSVAEVGREAMRAFFLAEAARDTPAGLSAPAAWEAYERAADGDPGVYLSELRSRRRA